MSKCIVCNRVPRGQWKGSNKCGRCTNKPVLQQLGQVPHLGLQYANDLENRYPNIKVELVVLAGSYAYGLNHANSDIDARGFFFCTDKRALLGLGKLPETVEDKGTDTSLHEFGKFVKLVVDCNPNIIEMLYMPELQGSTSDWFPEPLDFFSAKAIRAKHRGFANGQLKRAEKLMENPDSLQSKEYRKLVQHGWRILRQAEELLETGTMNIRVSEEEKEFYEWLLENPNNVRNTFESKMKRIDEIEPVIREELTSKELDIISEMVADYRLSYV